MVVNEKHILVTTNRGLWPSIFLRFLSLQKQKCSVQHLTPAAVICLNGRHISAGGLFKIIPANRELPGELLQLQQPPLPTGLRRAPSPSVLLICVAFWQESAFFTLGLSWTISALGPLSNWARYLFSLDTQTQPLSEPRRAGCCIPSCSSSRGQRHVPFVTPLFLLQLALMKRSARCCAHSPLPGKAAARGDNGDTEVNTVPGQSNSEKPSPLCF